MGSCISPVVANIFMEYVERQALTSFRESPKIWIRYIDIFCVIFYSIIEEFLQHINSVSPNIQFTVEIEKDRPLPFLDAQITRTLTLHFELPYVYQKPTHTNRYLQFDSHHPRHQKLADAKSLFNRVDTHISNVSDKRQLREINEVLSLNGFPTKFSSYKKVYKRTSPDSNILSQLSQLCHISKECQIKLSESLIELK